MDIIGDMALVINILEEGFIYGIGRRCTHAFSLAGSLTFSQDLNLPSLMSHQSDYWLGTACVSRPAVGAAEHGVFHAVVLLTLTCSPGFFVMMGFTVSTRVLITGGSAVLPLQYHWPFSTSLGSYYSQTTGLAAGHGICIRRKVKLGIIDLYLKLQSGNVAWWLGITLKHSISGTADPWKIYWKSFIYSSTRWQRPDLLLVCFKARSLGRCSRRQDAPSVWLCLTLGTIGRLKIISLAISNGALPSAVLYSRTRSPILAAGRDVVMASVFVGWTTFQTVSFTANIATVILSHHLQDTPHWPLPAQISLPDQLLLPLSFLKHIVSSLPCLYHLVGGKLFLEGERKPCRIMNSCPYGTYLQNLQFRILQQKWYCLRILIWILKRPLCLCQKCQEQRLWKNDTILNLLCGMPACGSGKDLCRRQEATELKGIPALRLYRPCVQDLSLGTRPILAWLSLKYGAGRLEGQALWTGWPVALIKAHWFLLKMAGALKLGLEDKIDLQVGSLSGGQRQALAPIPPWRRPTDSGRHTAAWSKVQRERHEPTEKLVRENIWPPSPLHNLKFAINYGDRLFMMHRGNTWLIVRQRVWRTSW